MASKAAAKAAGGVVDVSKKYTVQSTGVWERIRRVFAVAPSRSNGVPLNAQYRNPPPGSNPPAAYDDPVTIPAADLADNPYWKRDVRRAYANPSVLTQGDVVGLLTVGSKARPVEEGKEGALAVGDEGQKQLALVREEGAKGLAAFFEKGEGGKGIAAAARAVLGEDGLPPRPVALSSPSKDTVKRYVIEEEQAYPGQ